MNEEITIRDINEFLQRTGFEFSFKGNLDTPIQGFSSLFNYKPGTITFIVPERSFIDHKEHFKDKAISLIIKTKNEENFDCLKNIIELHDPRKAFFCIVERFFGQFPNELTTGVSSKPEVYRKNSYVDPRAKIGKNVKIGIGCVIEGNVVIGDNTIIHHNVVVRNNTKIGNNCAIYSGTVIGEEGFNYTTDDQGRRHMIKHYGGVTIEDNVRIGDKCCITQGSIDDTTIKRGVKMNKMVHIAHNDIIGENTVITAPTQIFGSVTIGPNCHIAANVIRNQVTIGEEAVLGLGAVVVKDVNAGETVIGNPAKPLK